MSYRYQIAKLQFIFVLLISIVIFTLAAIAIQGNQKVDSWPRGFALTDDNSIFHIKTTYGSVRSTAKIFTIGYLVDDVNTTFPVVIKYPPPPGALNLKKQGNVRSWISSVTSTSKSEIYVNMDKGANKNGYVIAVIQKIGIGGWVAGICACILGILFTGFVFWLEYKGRHLVPYTLPYG